MEWLTGESRDLSLSKLSHSRHRHRSAIKSRTRRRQTKNVVEQD